MMICSLSSGAELWDIDLEEGDLSDFSSNENDGGDLSAHADGAMAGTSYGMKLVIDDTTNIYGAKTQGAIGTSHFRMRFYLDTNSLIMAQSDQFTFLYAYTNNAPWTLQYFTLYCPSVGTYRIGCFPVNDAGALTEDYETITDAAHYIEIYIKRATDADDSDGTVEWWIDGVSKGTWSNVDNYDVFADTFLFRFGAFSTIDAGTSGTFYMDEILANNDGTLIGPHTEGGIGAKAGWYNYQQNQ